jgi:hypothetical protein
MGASSQAARKTHSRVRGPQETSEAEPETTQRGEFIDVDTIPSPHEEPTSPTPVEEETQAPTTTAMDIDPQESMQGRQVEDAGNPQRPVRAEGAHRVNGATTVQTEVVTPRQPHRAGSAQQQEGLVEDITGQPESDAGKRQMEVGPQVSHQEERENNPWCGHHTDILTQQ